jgi:hypothetical protein
VYRKGTGREEMDRRFLKHGEWLLAAVFLWLAFLQAMHVHKTYGRRYLLQVYENRAESALDRSAIFSEGHEFADYIAFLRETVPENAKVILPPREPVQSLANVGYMQYFLMPRDIQNCGTDEVEACVLRMTGPTSYIITAWKFPPADLALQVKRFIPMPGEERGVYAPK